MPPCSQSRRGAGGRPRWQIAALRRQGIGSNFGCTYETVSDQIRKDMYTLYSGRYMRMTARRGAHELAVPVAIALDVAPWHLEQTIGAVICNDFLGNTPGAADLVAVLAVEQVLEGVEAIGRTRRSRVEGPLESIELLGGARSGWIAVAVAGEVGRVGAGALNIGVWSQCRHREGRPVVWAWPNLRAVSVAKRVGLSVSRRVLGQGARSRRWLEKASARSQVHSATQ